MRDHAAAAAPRHAAHQPWPLRSSLGLRAAAAPDSAGTRPILSSHSLSSCTPHAARVDLPGAAEAQQNQPKPAAPPPQDLLAALFPLCCLLVGQRASRQRRAHRRSARSPRSSRSSVTESSQTQAALNQFQTPRAKLVSTDPQQLGHVKTNSSSFRTLGCRRIGSGGGTPRRARGRPGARACLEGSSARSSSRALEGRAAQAARATLRRCGCGAAGLAPARAGGNSAQAGAREPLGEAAALQLQQRSSGAAAGGGVSRRRGQDGQASELLAAVAALAALGLLLVGRCRRCSRRRAAAGSRQ